MQDHRPGEARSGRPASGWLTAAPLGRPMAQGGIPRGARWYAASLWPSSQQPSARARYAQTRCLRRRSPTNRAGRGATPPTIARMASRAWRASARRDARGLRFRSPARWARAACSRASASPRATRTPTASWARRRGDAPRPAARSRPTASPLHVIRTQDARRAVGASRRVGPPGSPGTTPAPLAGASADRCCSAARRGRALPGVPTTGSSWAPVAGPRWDSQACSNAQRYD